MSFLSSSSSFNQLLFRIKYENANKVFIYKFPNDITVSDFISKIMTRSIDVFKIDDSESIKNPQNRIRIVAHSQDLVIERDARTTMLAKYGENLSLMLFYVKSV
jgi:pyruvate carboxylase